MNINAFRLRIRGCLPCALAFFLCVTLDMSSFAATNPELPDLLSATPQELRARIDSASDVLATALSPAAREQLKNSLSRFYLWVDGYCRGNDLQAERNPDVDVCMRNAYFNYLARIPESVYLIGGWTVYETGIYGLLWPDDELQQQDPLRPFTWSLQVIWPRIDAVDNALTPGFSAALSEHVRTFESNWAASGWSQFVEVRLAAIDACYISARITVGTYGGGAHPYEVYETFNWNRSTRQPVNFSSLFRPNPDSLNGVLSLYKKRLGDSATGMPDASLMHAVQFGFMLTGNGLRIIEQEGRTRVEKLPEVDLTWDDLTPWLLPDVPCSIDAARESRK